MRSKAYMFLMLVIIIWPFTSTAALRMNDFAYGLRVTSPVKSGLVRLILPEVVYRHLAGTDCSDIRVFRMDGRVIPHLLGRPAAVREHSPDIRALPFFPLYSVTPGTGSSDVRIRTDASGAVLSLSDAPETGGRVPAPAYLIDSSRLSHGVETLVLRWRRHRPNVLVKARLETSNDLVQWRTLVASVALADIRHGEQRLVNRIIMLPPGQGQGPYLRLSWLNGADAMTLEAVEGVLRPSDRLPARRWIRAAFRTDREAPGSMQFDSGGRFPVDQIDLQLSQTNSLVTGTVQSRDSDRDVWRVHHRGVFYQLEMEHETLHNDPVTVPETKDRFWKLDIDKRQSSLGNSVPRLLLGWRPQELFFVAERGAAYLVAYGSQKATALPPPPDLVENIIASGDRAALVGIGPRLELGGPSRVKQPPRAESGRMVSLSTLLLGCVLLLAFFAWWAVHRLRQIDATPRR